MFGETHSIQTMEKAAILKYQNMPQKLYKYRAINKHTWDALKNDVLYVEKTSLQNDLREANIVLTNEAEASVYQRLYDNMKSEYGLPDAVIRDSNDFISVANQTYKRNISNSDAVPDFKDTPLYKSLKIVLEVSISHLMNDINTQGREMYSICSFSAVNDNDLMWAHYGGSCAGCCIEYDFKKLGSSQEDVQLMFPVLYVDDNRVFVNYYDPEKGLDGSVGMFAATLKNAYWSYEKEWRRLYLGTEGGRVHSMPVPDAIYLGERIDKNNKRMMIGLCETREIKLFQMYYNQIRDKICFDPIF